MIPEDTICTRNNDALMATAADIRNQTGVEVLVAVQPLLRYCPNDART